MNKPRLVIISGISGSGKSTVLNAFEDMGFSCIENLPVPLLASFADLLCSSDAGEEGTAKVAMPGWSGGSRFALLLNVREENSYTQIRPAVARLRDAGVDVSLLFLDCQDEIIVRRYSETRRPHPLLIGMQTSRSLAEAVLRERELLSAYREAATRVFDTTAFSPHELRRVIEDYCQHHTKMEVSLVSFGYRFGVPNDADLLIDVRFLANPHFVRELRPFSGLEKAVSDYVFQDPDAEDLVRRYIDLLEFLLPRYQSEGKRYLTIGIGCTGGRHRSIAVAMRLKEELEGRGMLISVRHRDIDRS